MRISKPKGQTADYKLYDTIALRDADKANLINGQEVKVLDASGDPAIKSGWAIYKFDKESGFFDLIEKEEQPKDLVLDNKTIFSNVTRTSMLNAPELANPFREDIRILQDFDISAIVNVATKRIEVRINGGMEQVDIPIQTVDGIKYLALRGFDYFSSEIKSSMYGKGKFAHVPIQALIKNTKGEAVHTMSHSTPEDGQPVLVIPRDSLKDRWVYIAQLRIDLPYASHWPWSGEMVTVYKYWKRALAPAEQRIIIPKMPTIPAFPDVQKMDTNCFSKLQYSEVLTNPDVFDIFPLDCKILEDFDFDIKASDTVQTIELTLRNGTPNFKNIPVQTSAGIRYLHPTSFNCSQKSGAKAGELVHWMVEFKITDEKTEWLSSSIGGFTDGKFSTPKTGDILRDSILALTVRAKQPSAGQPFDPKYITVFKHYKKALAPAEERIVIPEPTAPQAVEIDNYTIEKNGAVLTVPASLNPIRHNYTIRKNFQLDLNFDDKNSIRVTPRGADENGFLQIPIEKDGIVFALQLGTVDLPVSAFAGSPEMVHFGIMAKVESDQAPKVACEYLVEADGSPIKFVPSPTDLRICIAQVRAKLPVNTDGWREEFVTMWRYWETALLETFSETPVDGYGAEYIEIGGMKQITSIGSMNPTYYNLRYLQDFDFDFKISYSKTNNALSFVGIPIGGDRTIKITRAIGDGNADGTVLPKETLFGSIKTFSGTRNDPEKGKYLYLHLRTNMNKIEAIQNVDVLISTIPQIKPQSNYMVTYGVFKIYIPTDEEQFDYGKVFAYKYWKNALASFDELMQDYKERNP
jgi:hypothetical protein